ncbi:MAG: ThiF family adenylyltransferase [Bacteroidia bacterium]|nr:ThiF family adenylyltransferase [Bacteroidia bacterium]MDW8236410.1 ThiF family adenylyltransferase [Bacteroidia bacterium]
MNEERCEFGTSTEGRYVAQLRLPGWSQSKLQEASVLIIGVGGLGQPAALYLTAMGIGRLLLIDPDQVEEANLHRQPLYTPAHLQQLKVEVLAHHLCLLRPDLKVETYPYWADEKLLEEVGSTTDIWIDGTDNIQSRLAISRAALRLGKPWVYGSVYQWEGQVALIEGLAYEEFFGEIAESPSCSQGGVLGSLPGLVGAWQASLAVLYLQGLFSNLRNRLFRIDLSQGIADAFFLASFSAMPLEISAAQALAYPDAVWIDLREQLNPPLPVPSLQSKWHEWESWQLPLSPVILVCERGERSRFVAYALRHKTQRKDIHSLRGGAPALLAHFLT